MLPTRSSVVLGLALSAALVLVACPRKKEPSPQYTEAHQRFTALYSEKLDNAFIDPRMTEVERLLTQVPEDSLDAPLAADLSKRIAEGRARQVAQAQEIAAAVESATAPDPNYRPLEPRPPEDAGAEAPEADPNQPVPGMSQQDFLRRFSTCFAPYEDIQVQGRGMMASYVLKDMALCRSRHPGHAGKAVLFQGSKLWGTGDLSRMERRDEDGGLLPEAGR